MKKLVMMLELTGLPLLAMAQNGPGQGMGLGQGMGQNQDGGQQRPPGPPPEFLAACKDKPVGASVTVNTPHGEKQGICQLMFVPSGQGQGRQRPPQ